MYSLRRFCYLNVEGGAKGAKGLGGARSGRSLGNNVAGADPSTPDNDALDSTGAIVSRDGIVGAWSVDALRRPPGAGRRDAVDKNDSLADWEPWVRGAVFDVELLAPLSFASGAGVPDHGFRLDVRDPADVGPPQPWLTLVRPDEGDTAFRKQIKLVNDYAELREDRQAEILSQAPQLVTYWAAVAGLHPSRNRWTLELIGAAVRLAIAVEMRFKHALAFPRPVQFSPQIQPMIQTPGHSSFPSGHSTEAHCTAAVLAMVMGLGIADPVATMLMRQARRIAINRTVAGVHFPVDSRAGQVLGISLAEYITRRATGGGLVAPRMFDANTALDLAFTTAGTNTLDALRDPDTKHADVTVPDSTLFGWLWNNAADEWK